MSSSAPGIASPSVERTVPLMKHGVPGRAVGEVVAVLEGGRALDEEGAEDRRLRGAGRAAVVHADDEHRQPERVGGEDELLALVVGDVAGAREEVDGGEPLLLGELDLAGEGVEMADERLHDLAQPAGRGCRRSWPRRPGSGRRRRGCAARSCVAGWSVTPRPSRGPPGLSSATARSMGRRDPASRRARVSSSRASASSARSWPRRPMSCTPTGRPVRRARHGHRHGRKAERAGVRAQRELAAGRMGSPSTGPKLPRRGGATSGATGHSAAPWRSSQGRPRARGAAAARTPRGRAPAPARSRAAHRASRGSAARARPRVRPGSPPSRSLPRARARCRRPRGPRAGRAGAPRRRRRVHVG